MRCSYCDGTGKFKKPLNDGEYDRRFDYYESKADFISMGECRERALSDVGYTLIDCPYCQKAAE